MELDYSFKNKYSLSQLIELQKKYKVQISQKFFALSHGKSPADGIGGCLKRMIDRRVMSKNLKITNAQEFFDVASELPTSIEMFFVAKKSIESLINELTEMYSKIAKFDKLSTFHSFRGVDEKHIECKISSSSQNSVIKKIMK